MIAAIARHEWRRQRAGLTFWLLLAAVQLLIAWLAFAQLEAFAAIAPQLKATATKLGATRAAHKNRILSMRERLQHFAVAMEP